MVSVSFFKWQYRTASSSCVNYHMANMPVTFRTTSISFVNTLSSKTSYNESFDSDIFTTACTAAVKMGHWLFWKISICSSLCSVTCNLWQSGNLDWWVLGVLASYRQSHHRHRNQSSMAFKARSDSRWTSRQQIDHERELLTSKSMFTQIDCGGKHHFIYEVNHFGFLRQSVE